MTLRVGVTFRAADPKHERHLWVVLDPENHPADKVLIANCTSWTSGKDSACILRRGDHPFVKRKTCINYQRSRLVSRKKLKEALETGAVIAHRDATPDVLKRIRDGAAQSKFTPLENLQLLKDQGLVEPSS
jgi:hypothetical protein